jgi:hypothetical protein
MFRKTVQLALSLAAGLTLAGNAPGFAQGSATGNPAIACFRQTDISIGGDVTVMDANGAHLTVIVPLPGLHTSGLSWSPDLDPNIMGYQGNIVYGIMGNPWTLWTVDINIPGSGTFVWGAPRQIPIDIPVTSPVSTRFDAFYPAWSPDGAWIALHGNASNGSTTIAAGIWTIPWTAETLTVPTQPTLVAHAEYPCWDPSSTTIAGSYRTDIIATQIFPAIPPITLIANAFPDGTVMRPSWSSSGMAFRGITVTTSGKTQKSTSSLYVLHSDTGIVQPVPGSAGVGDPSWSPDGFSLVATTSSGIVKIDPVTGAQTILAANPRKATLKGPNCRR